MQANVCWRRTIMTSLFGFPLDKLTNISDSSEHAEWNEIVIERVIFVGGRYNEKHNDIFALFDFNVTEFSHNQATVDALVQLFSLFPIVMILACQIGFALLQSGASRVESAGVPFLATMATFASSCLSYWAVGYAFARSEGLSVMGYHHWFSHEFEPKFSPDWLLHLSLAITTSNIATFGGLERCPLLVYCLLAPIVAGVIHSMAVRWAWHHTGWLLTYSALPGIPYRDFGGSGVIHVVGGASALVFSMILGPRYSRMREKTSKILFNDLDGHSLPSEMLGGYLLIICFTCCNCVRVTSTCLNCHAGSDMARVLINTIIAAASSYFTTVFTVHILKNVLGGMRFHWQNSRLAINGLIVGIVAVSAGCNAYPHWASCVIGATAAIGYVIWSVLLYIGRVDDPIGAVAVHLGGGLWGVICVHIFQEDIGLIFTEEQMKALLAILWNVIGALVLAGCSALVTGFVLAIPRGLNYIPLNHVQEIHGIDILCIGQQAYPNGNKVTPFTTDFIEDRERFLDSNPASPLSTTVTSPTSYSVARLQQYNEMKNMSDISVPNGNLHVNVKDLPSFVMSPGDSDKRVWFSGGNLADLAAPLTPLIDYENETDRWNDVAF